MLGDGSGPIDQGKGYLDVSAAAAKLGSVKDGKVRDEFATPIVALNMLKAGFMPIFFRNNTYTAQLKDLKPGQVAQFFVPSDVWTDQLTVKVSNVKPALPPEQQNQLFGDDVFLTVVDALTSVANRASPSSWSRTRPTPSPSRTPASSGSAVQGDSTNAGHVSAEVTITRTRAPQGRPSSVGRIAEGEEDIYEVAIPAGALKAVFETSWLRSWALYPANDLDMVLISPTGVVNVTGASANSPERVEINAPAPGVWTIVIQGFAVASAGSGSDDDPEAADAENDNRHRGSSRNGYDRRDHDRVSKERYALRVTVDGSRLQID